VNIWSLNNLKEKRIPDRIYRIFWIEGPSAKKYPAAGEKIPLIL
jgi:hypothetical protein